MSDVQVIPTDLKAAAGVAERLLRRVEAKGYPEQTRFAIRLALEEAFSNAIEHGNKFDAGKSITVAADVNDDRAVITITDEGEGFDPDAVPDPTVDENLEKPCGRGLMLMRAYMDKVTFNEQGNEVCLIKSKC
jgi:serine/threonine-protein kinase RsbW